MEEISKYEKQISEANYQHKEDINELEKQHRMAVENLKKFYEDKIEAQDKEMGKELLLKM